MVEIYGCDLKSSEGWYSRTYWPLFIIQTQTPGIDRGRQRETGEIKRQRQRERERENGRERETMRAT